MLDPFAGSGTIAIAAERIGRKAQMIEMDPYYVDLIIRRWQTVTGGTARLATGEAFADVQAHRVSSASTASEQANRDEESDQ